MKTAKALLSACLITGLTLATATAGRDTLQLDDYGVQLDIEVVKMPIFPRKLIEEGYNYGDVKIALDIDNDGELRDWLVVESTHPLFTEAISRVIDAWRFSPPYINDQNRSVVAHLDVSFTARSSVVSFDIASAALAVRFNELTGFAAHATQLADPQDLDAAPYPLAQPKPVVPRDVIQANNGARAVFTFYVDEAGQVRIPALAQTDGNPDLGMLLAAQDALTQWRFQPPTVKSQPVKVKLSQTFVFRD